MHRTSAARVTTFALAWLLAGCGAVGRGGPAASPRLTQGEAEALSGPVVDTVLPPSSAAARVELATWAAQGGVLMLVVVTAGGRELLAWDVAGARLLARAALPEDACLLSEETAAPEDAPGLRDLLRADDQPLACTRASPEGAPWVACTLRGAVRLVRLR